MPFSIIKDGVSDILTVSEAEIVEAMRLVMERVKIVIEASSAADEQGPRLVRLRGFGAAAGECLPVEAAREWPARMGRSRHDERGFR